MELLSLQGIVFVLGLYSAFFVLELLRPAVKNPAFSQRIKNISFALLFIVGGGTLSIALNAFLSIPSHKLGGDLPEAVLISLAYLFTADLLFYWYHRLQHHSTKLWLIHELHHSDEELNVTTSLRTHWLENPIQTVLIATPALLMIGTNPLVAIIIPILQFSWLFLTHSNLKIHLGPFSPILCGPQVHRIHHSNLSKHRNKNFAQFFPVLDIIFGTYYHPSRNEFPTTGTATMKSSVSILEASMKPFYIWLKS